MRLIQKVKSLATWRGVGLGLAAGYLAGAGAFVYRQIARVDVSASLSDLPPAPPSPAQQIATEEVPGYQMRHSVEDGIERIVYTPRTRRFQTPLLFVHGMFHDAWTWHRWQPLLAGWGWESIAFSLPGHGRSPERRPTKLATLDYYLGFLKAEVDRLPRLPVMIGHSMGGALTQWYLKFAGDLPAAVLAAPWVAHSALLDGTLYLLRADLPGIFRMLLDWSATPWVRSPASAARLFLGKNAITSPQELHQHLGPESALVLFQHNPPFWQPPQAVLTPNLWLASEKDAVVSVDGLRRSAEHYRGYFHIVPGAGHNLMMERDYRQTARYIHNWLIRRGIT